MEVRFRTRADLAETINEVFQRGRTSMNKSVGPAMPTMSVPELHSRAAVLGMTVKYLCNVTPGCDEPAFVRVGTEKMPCRKCYDKMKKTA